MAHNENKKPVLSQLMAVSETWKNSAAVPETGENVSHYLGISDVRRRWIHTGNGTLNRGKPHIPADNDIEENQLDQAKPASLVDTIAFWALGRHGPAISRAWFLEQGVSGPGR